MDLVIKLASLARLGKHAEIGPFFAAHPTVDVNGKINGKSCLHVAIWSRSRQTVREILKHKDVDLNFGDDLSESPLGILSLTGQVEMMKLLLSDERLKTGGEHCKLLQRFLKDQNYEMIEWLIASGRELGHVDLLEENSVCPCATHLRQTAMRNLLRRFQTNPTLVRHEVHMNLQYSPALAVGFFAVVIFLCDGLLQLKPNSAADVTPKTRFLAMACRLPMELQMILCHYAAESARDSIQAKDSEIAFQFLAKALADTKVIEA